MEKIKLNKADQYFIETLKEIQNEGSWDQNPRPKWRDGKPAHSKFVTQKTFDYRIDKNETPLISLRPTAIKGAFYDIEAIYQKQTNVIAEMNPLIKSWWIDFEVGLNKEGQAHIGQTYGHTVRRYDLMNKLLKGMEINPFGRRHKMNLWQEQQMKEDPKALPPCAYETLYSITEAEDAFEGIIRFVDMTLNQRSQDYIMTASINPFQYTMLGMMICGHLTHKTGIKHVLRKFKHNVQNVHIYDRHMWAVEELLEIDSAYQQATVSLPVSKDFYDYGFEDFHIEIPWETEKLSKRLELAV